jgi:hypothetical protein
VALRGRWHDAQGRWYTGAADLHIETKGNGSWERLLLPLTAPGKVSTFSLEPAVQLRLCRGVRRITDTAEDGGRHDDAYAGQVQVAPPAR